MQLVGNVTLVNAFAGRHPRRRRGDPATIQPRPAIPGTRSDRPATTTVDGESAAYGAVPAALRTQPRKTSVVLADDEE